MNKTESFQLISEQAHSPKLGMSHWEDLALTKTLFEKEVLLCPRGDEQEADFVEIIQRELVGPEIKAQTNSIRKNGMRPSFLSKLGNKLKATSNFVRGQPDQPPRKISDVSNNDSDSFVDLGEIDNDAVVVMQMPMNLDID